MNRFNFIFSILLASFLGFLTISCEKPGPDGPDSGDNGNPGDTLTFSCILAAEAGSTTTIEISTLSSWSVSTKDPITISPAEGDSGTHILTIKANETNEKMLEEMHMFTVIDGGEPQAHRYFVVQRGTPGINIESTDPITISSEQYINVPYNGAFSPEDLKATADVEWIRYAGIDTTTSHVPLPDGINYSDYTYGFLLFHVEETNSSDKDRNAKLTIELGDFKAEIPVIQKAFSIGEPDFSRQFYKTSLIYKISGTFCTACPHMTYHLDSLEKIKPGRTIVANIHAGSTNGLDWIDGRVKLVQDLWKEGFMPSAFFNNYGDVMGLTLDYLVDIFVGLVNQASELFPATTGIAGSAAVSGDELSIDVRIAAGENAVKEGYRLTVLLMEDGLEAKQAGAEYVPLENPNIHDHVIRGSLSKDYDLGGESLELTPGQVTVKNFKVNLKELPSGFSAIKDINNVKVLAYVTYDDSYTPEKNGEGAVHTVEYSDFGFMVDNAAVFGVNSGVGYRYEY